MMPPDSSDRGLPSVNERRLRKARLWQWLFIIAIFCAIAAGAAWLIHGVRSTWQGRLGNNPAAPEAMANTWSKRMFELPAIARPAPPKPAAPPVQAPVVASAPAPASASAKPVDRMMLTDANAQGLPRGEVSEGGSPVKALLSSQSNANANGDGGPLKGLLNASQTTRARASLLGDRNLILAKGVNFDCILNTKLVSTVSGMVSCTVPRNVYSDNGKVVLIERGSTVTGEYRSDLQVGRERIFVLWDRLKTVEGVVINLNSPATDELGEAGVGGDIDNHWWQRIGASVLLSLVEDAVQYKTAQETSNGNGLVIFPNTSQQGETLAGKILDNTINIPPTLTRNQGEKVNVFVARDLDFSSVYELRTQ